nr:hypothetical protein CFP56_25197 [Quercus suber]
MSGLDVVWTDRTLVLYEQENLSKLWDILAAYAWIDTEMSAILSRLKGIIPSYQNRSASPPLDVTNSFSGPYRSNIQICDNSFTGLLPLSLLNLPNLSTLFLDGNQLVGPLPSHLVGVVTIEIIGRPKIPFHLHSSFQFLLFLASNAQQQNAELLLQQTILMSKSSRCYSAIANRVRAMSYWEKNRA